MFGTSLRSIKDISEFLRHLWDRHEKHASSIALVVGFVIDYLTLTRIDQLFDNLVLITYLLVIAFGITLVHVYHSVLRMKIAPAGTKREKWFLWIRTVSPVVIQFAVGGMMSGLVVFYSRSTSLIGSWPFLLLLVGFMIGNEFLKERYTRLTFQVGVWYFVLFSYLMFAIPMIAREIGTPIFVVSGIVSLLVVAGFVRILALLSPDKYLISQKNITRVIVGVFVFVNVLYFVNIIPPLPLSLKSADVYHYIERVNGNYIVEQEKDAWYEFLFLHDTVHIQRGERMYVYSAIFAPRGLEATVIHEWQKHDGDGWSRQARIPFSVVGGRDGGFRGYTFSDGLTNGSYRVVIKTENGQIIGRVRFDVEVGGEKPELERVELE